MIRTIIATIRLIGQSYWNLRARIQFALRGVRWPNDLIVRGKLGLSAEGTILIGEHVTIVNDSKYNRAGISHPTQLVAARDAILTIGNHVGISGASLYSHQSITIGDYVLIGANCRVYDTDFHPMDYMARRRSEKTTAASVIIEDDVWLGANVTVLKGVTIGPRSVIAAGSVVTSNIPQDCLAGGIPAKVIRKLAGKET